MAETALDIIEKRISVLESIVFGNADKDALYPKDKLPSFQCIDSLLNQQRKITAAVASKTKLMQAFENLPELRRYMDPAYTDELMLSEDAKGEIILAEEDFLRRMSSQLKTVKEHDAAISSEHIRNVPKLSGRLQALSQIHIQLQDQTAEVTEESAKLIETYNSIITNLSKMFISWDEEITKLELQEQPKHTVD